MEELLIYIKPSAYVLPQEKIDQLKRTRIKAYGPGGENNLDRLGMQEETTTNPFYKPGFFNNKPIPSDLDPEIRDVLIEIRKHKNADLKDQTFFEKILSLYESVVSDFASNIQSYQDSMSQSI